MEKVKNVHVWLYAVLIAGLITALVLGAAPGAVVGFFTTDSLSLLFTGLIVWIARKLDGVYEDQKHYLLRIQAQEEHKGGNL